MQNPVSYSVCSRWVKGGLPLVPGLTLIKVPAPDWLTSRRGSTISLIKVQSSHILPKHLVVEGQADRGSRILRGVLGTDEVGSVIGGHG